MSEKQDWNELRLSLALIVVSLLLVITAVLLCSAAEGQVLTVQAGRAALYDRYRPVVIRPIYPVTPLWRPLPRVQIEVTVRNPAPFEPARPRPALRAVSSEAARREWRRIRRRNPTPCTFDWWILVWKGEREDDGRCK